MAASSRQIGLNMIDYLYGVTGTMVYPKTVAELRRYQSRDLAEQSYYSERAFMLRQIGTSNPESMAKCIEKGVLGHVTGWPDTVSHTGVIFASNETRISVDQSFRKTFYL